MSRRRAAGFLLLPVALLLVLVATLAFMTNRSGPVAAQLAGGERDAALARVVAEAGLQHALFRANRNACSGYDMASTPFGAQSYTATFTPASGSPVSLVATGTTAGGAKASVSRSGVAVYDGVATTVLQPDAAAGVDAYIDGWWPTDNYGNASTLWLLPGEERPLLRFDLSSMPAGGRIIKAELALYQTSGGGSAGASDRVRVHRVTGDWSESAVSWAIRTGVLPWTTPGGDHDSLAVAENGNLASGAWKTWDVTPLAAGWLAGTIANQGVLLKSTAGTGILKYASSDATNATLRPKLTLTYYACECGGGSGSSLVLQPGTEGKDTALLDGSKGNHNTGTGKQLWVSNASDKHRALIGFDVSTLPPAATITSATLSLYDGGPDAVTSGTAIGLYRMTRGWVEGTGVQTGSTPADGASWNAYDGTNDWDSSGGDFDSTMIASSPVPDAAARWHNFDVKTLVSGWHNATYLNHGVLVQTISGTLTKAHLASSEDLDPALRPKLTIGYSCGCGAPCAPAPPPAKDYLDVLPLACSASGAANASAGSKDWSPWAWSELNEGNGWCNGSVRIEPDLGDHSLQLKAHDAGATRELDLSSFHAAYLTFSYRFVDVPAGNSLRVRVSSDGGSNWVELSPINGPGNHADYTSAVYDISAWRSANTRIGFIAAMPVTTGAPINQVFIDDVQVTNQAPPAPPGELVIAPGADTMVYENSASTNYGSDPQVLAGKNGNPNYRAMLRFDLASLPSGSTVTGAKLRLYLSGGNGANADLEVFRIGSAWTEGTVTWNSSGGGAPTGGSYDDVRIYPSTPGWVEWTIPPALLHEWKDGITPNNGLVLVPNSGKNRWGVFASPENATTANRPQLVVTYTE